MNVSPEGRSFTESFEGLSLKAYLCPAGVWTIGYGHTQGVKPGDVLPDQTAADMLLSQDLASFGSQVSALCGVATQHEYDALLDLSLNIGIGGFSSSTVLRKHRAGDKTGAAAAFGMWNKATIDGVLQPVAGLTRRRAAEAAVYLTPQEAAHPMPALTPVAPQSMPQAVEPPPPIPAGYIEQPSGNVVLADIKDSKIVQKANVGQVIAAGTTGVVTAATGVQAAKGMFEGVSFNDVGIIVAGVVVIVAMVLAFFYFRSIRSDRVSLHERGIV